MPTSRALAATSRQSDGHRFKAGRNMGLQLQEGVRDAPSFTERSAPCVTNSTSGHGSCVPRNWRGRNVKLRRRRRSRANRQRPPSRPHQGREFRSTRRFRHNASPRQTTWNRSPRRCGGFLFAGSHRRRSRAVTGVCALQGVAAIAWMRVSPCFTIARQRGRDRLPKPLNQRDFLVAGTHLAAIGDSKPRTTQTPFKGPNEIDPRSFVSIHAKHRYRSSENLRENSPRAAPARAGAGRGRRSAEGAPDKAAQHAVAP